MHWNTVKWRTSFARFLVYKSRLYKILNFHYIRIKEHSFRTKKLKLFQKENLQSPSDHKIHLCIILLLLVKNDQKISYSCIFPKIFLQINHQRKVHSISFWIYDLRTWHVWKVPYYCFQHAVSILFSKSLNHIYEVTIHITSNFDNCFSPALGH